MHVRPHMITQNRFVTRVHRARLYRPASLRTATSVDWLTMLVSVQVCLGIQVLRDWGVLDVNGESTVGALFHGLSTGECESAEGFRLEIAYADLPVSCGISLSQSGKFQSLPLSVKIQDAIEFGKFFKFVLQCHDTTASICFVNIKKN